MSGKAEAMAEIDRLLRAAVAAGEVPGVVAVAADRSGAIYEGAFGRRSCDGDAAMTRDTIFRIFSMTKAITCTAAMQLVEQGRLALDAPVPDIGEPVLNTPQVLTGFDAAGKPLLHPAARPMTLRQLMTHTAGFTYEFWNADTARYVETGGAPSVLTGKLDAYRRPLNFDPGARWEYGINIDWVGRIIEAVSGQPLDAYLREHVLSPLGMADTGFALTPAQQARQATLHQRQADGSLVPQMQPRAQPEFFAGGGGLYSTGPDYLRFLQMLLHDGSLGGARILKPETVSLMHQNHIRDMPAGVLKSAMPALTDNVDFFPGAPLRWSLAHMLHLAPGPNGRSAGTLTWAGLANLYYWLDPGRGISGIIMTQILPFADPAVLRLYGGFERGVYALAAPDGAR
ncbi:MAG: serine hydrolase domain-containing protein [Thiohalocapsa sp.]